MNWIILFSTILSAQAWAAKVPHGCEILLETRYGRIMNLAAHAGQITLEELEEASRQDHPTNPLNQRERDVDHLFAADILEKAIHHPKTKSDWPQIRESLKTLAVHLRNRAALVQEVSDSQRWIFNPKLHSKSEYGNPAKAKGLFAPNQFFTWNTDAVHTDTRTVELDTRNQTTSVLERNAQVIRRKNGELWLAGVNHNLGFVVRKVSNLEIHYMNREIFATEATLFEAQDGRLYVASGGTGGLKAYDITDIGKPKPLIAKEGYYIAPPVFHARADGQIFLAAPAGNGTDVFVLFNGKFHPIGSTTSAWPVARTVLLATSKDGSLYLGEPQVEPNHYRVWKFKDGQKDLVYDNPDAKFMMASAMTYQDSRGDLIFCISKSDPVIQFINLTNRNEPEWSYPIPAPLYQPAAWYKFGTGLEVLALSPSGADAMVISPGDGGVLSVFPAKAGQVARPEFGRMSDGQTYLAVDAGDHFQVYDLGKDIRK